MPYPGVSFLDNSLIKRASNAVAAGTTDVDPSGIDVQGYNSITFIFAFGTLTDTAVTSCSVKGSDDNSTFTALTDDSSTAVSVSVADTADNKLVVIEVINPTNRYLKPFIDRGTANAVVDGIIAILRNSRSQPTTADATVVGSFIAYNPTI